MLARSSLLVLLLATPSLHGSAGVWQYPAYGPSPRPLEAPTPRVARAAIPKDLVSGITVSHAQIIRPRADILKQIGENYAFIWECTTTSILQNIPGSVFIFCDSYLQKCLKYLLLHHHKYLSPPMMKLSAFFLALYDFHPVLRVVIAHRCVMSAFVVIIPRPP